MYSVQYASAGLESNRNSSLTNVSSLVTQTTNKHDHRMFLTTSTNVFKSRFDVNEMNLSTIISGTILPDPVSDSEAWPSLFVPKHRSVASFLPTNDFNYAESSDKMKGMIEEQWLSVNQSRAQDPYKSTLLWKRASGNRNLS